MTISPEDPEIDGVLEQLREKMVPALEAARRKKMLRALWLRLQQIKKRMPLVEVFKD